MLQTEIMNSWEKELYKNEADVIRHFMVGGLTDRRAADLLGIADFELNELYAIHWNKTAEEVAEILLSLS